MARASPLQTSVNSGEFSGRMLGRVDFDRYPRACKRARGVVLLPQGGFTKTPGSKYVVDIIDETKIGRILPFRFSAAQSYTLEMGQNAMRFCRRQAQITVADTDAAITNGTFTSNITGWTDISTGTAAIAHDATNGRLQLTGAANSIAWAEQSVTVTQTGVIHVLAFKTEGDLGASVLVQVGSATGGAQFFSQKRCGLGWHVIEFTPTTSPFYVQFGNDNDPVENVFVDDVSMLDNQPLQLTHDYSESELQDIRLQQTADVVYLFHPTKATRKLERRGHRTWSLVDVAWHDGPYGSINPGIDLEAKQLVKNPVFEDGIRSWDDISVLTSGIGGRIEYDGAQQIVIFHSHNSATEKAGVEQQISTGASGTDEYVLHFQIIGSQQTGGDLRHTVQIGTTSGAVDVMAATLFDPGWHSVAISSTATNFFLQIFLPGGRDATDLFAGGLAAALLYRENVGLLELNGTSGSVTCTALGTFAPFTSNDVGRLIRFEWPGKDATWGVITAFTSSSSVTVRLRRDAPYQNIPSESWRLGAWSAATGYAALAGFFQNRIIAANSTLQPQTLWFSQSADFENMRQDSFISASLVTENDDALIYTLASEEIDPIAWIAGRRKLVIGTEGGQWVAESSGVSIKATDIEIHKHTDDFAKIARPIARGDKMVFIESSGRKILDVGFDFENEAFITADLTILADHVLRSPVEEIAFQQRPYSTVWGRRQDGRLVTLAYNRRQDILGWSQQVLGGAFGSGEPVVESFAIIPGADDSSQDMISGDRDEVWMIVKRTVNSATVRTLEFFEGYYQAPEREDYATEALWEAAVKTDMEDAFYVDSGITYSGAATTTISVPHLEGETIAVLAQGRVHSLEVVTSGQITLDFAVTKAQIGLPRSWSFEGLKLPFGTQSGSAVGKVKSIDEMSLVLHDAGTFSYGVVTYDETQGRRVHNLQEVDFMRDGLAMDEAIPLFTGEVLRSFDSALTTDARSYLEGNDPLPFTLLAIAPQMQSGER